MKDKTQPSRSLTRNGPRIISERKVRANRENSEKSTGPRTPRGKAFSRRNATKHGLCASDLFPLLELPTESEQDFLDFHDRLREEYEPIGFEEGWEVERIAICKWKLGRAWRYENAEISNAVVGAYLRESRHSENDLDSKLQSLLTYESQICDFEVLFNGARKEIDGGNAIPADLKARLAAIELPQRTICEVVAKLMIEKHPELLKLCPQDPDSVLVYLAANLVHSLRDLPEPMPLFDKLKIACEQQAIPNLQAVDKMIRYEAAAERNLSKALDRLETLQRRRRGEAPPPRLNVNVS